MVLSQIQIEKLKYNGNVCISGLSASGKTTHSQLLAGEFGLTYVSGSQIQFNLMGMSPIQPKDFWISDEAKTLWNENEFQRVDSELLRIEGFSKGCLFDTSTMPWRHKYPALCIWLESNLQSRCLKSIISYRGRSSYPLNSYEDRMNEKDYATKNLYKKLYKINIGTDLNCFDLVVDISTFIKDVSLSSSLKSIAKAHGIIRSAVGYYLTSSRKFKSEFRSELRKNSKFILQNTLLSC
jgi:cytidylate kinase